MIFTNDINVELLNKYFYFKEEIIMNRYDTYNNTCIVKKNIDIKIDDILKFNSFATGKLEYFRIIKIDNSNKFKGYKEIYFKLI